MNPTNMIVIEDDSPPRRPPVQVIADNAGPRVCPLCTYVNVNGGRGQTRCHMCDGLLSVDDEAEALGRHGGRPSLLEGGQDGGATAAAMMLENVPCPACTFEGNALDAIECDVCATSFFGTGGGGAGGGGSGMGFHGLGHNHEHMSLAALRAMAAAADGASSRTSSSSSSSSDGTGVEGVRWGGGAFALPEVWSRERLVRGQLEERRDCTWGIIENLMVIASEAPLVPLGRVREVSTMRLCSPLAHYCQRTSDVLSFWSCGYRNIQMLSSSLLTLPLYRPVLFGGQRLVPQVLFIQRWIEWAWSLGFDADGAAQLGRSLAGKSTWIGACECVALLRAFRIRAVIVQAHSREKGGREGGEGVQELPYLVQEQQQQQQQQQQEEGGTEAGKAVMEFARAYFETPWEEIDVQAMARGVTERMAAKGGGGGGIGGAAVAAGAVVPGFLPGGGDIDGGRGGGGGREGGGGAGGGGGGIGAAVSYRPPLFFQHAGHSRTVVGVEERRPVAHAHAHRHTTTTSSSGSSSIAGQQQQQHQHKAHYNLLVFDPSSEGGKIYQTTRDKRGWQGLVKRGLHTLRHEEYQLVVVLPGLMEEGGKEWEAGKRLDSINLL